MAQNNVNPKNNKKKLDEIVELWYQATGEKFGKVNLATNADFENAKLAGKKEYTKMVSEKKIPLVYENPINLRKDQNLHLVFHSNTHYFDLSNPEKGVENNTNKTAFKSELEDKIPSDKTVVFFTGNLIGKEWKMGNLNNASIDNQQKILFWGLKKRLEELVRDIIFAANNGANEIILMNGREEHDAKQKLNVDVEKEAILDKFNDLLFKYAVDVVKDDETVTHKNVTVAYVPGVKKTFNVVRKNANNKEENYTFSVHTNLKSNSENIKTSAQTATKQHAGFAPADAIFVQAENVAGTIDDDGNVFFVSGNSTYKSASRGNLPSYAPKGRNTCTLLLGEKSHDLQVVWNMNYFDKDNYMVERAFARERAVEEYLIKLCEEKLQEKHNNFVNKQSKIEKGE